MVDQPRRRRAEPDTFTNLGTLKADNPDATLSYVGISLGRNGKTKANVDASRAVLQLPRCFGRRPQRAANDATVPTTRCTTLSTTPRRHPSRP